jgi:hypothetical protein
LESNNVVTIGLAHCFGKSYSWAAGLFIGDIELRIELWNFIARISGFDD